MNITHIALIGAGLTGTTLLKRLVRNLPTRLNTQFQIDVFELSSDAGPGMAYMEAIDNLLLNRAASRMYASHVGDFYRWMQKKKGCDDRSGDLARAYLPRRYFGEYLREVFANTIAESSLRNICVTLHNEVISDVSPTQNGFELRLRNQESRNYQFLFVTTGNDIAIDHYGLMGTPGFYSSPFPLSQYESLLTSNQTKIGIIGSRLCAVDVSNYLLLRKPSSKITMMSRTGKVPRRVIPIHCHTLTEFTEEAIESLVKKNNGVIRLRHVKILLQQEIDLHCPGINLEQVFTDPASLEQDTDICWRLYSIFGSTNRVTSMIWRYLPVREKRIFLRRHSSMWLHARIGIPNQTSEEIKKNEQAGSLVVRAGIRQIERAQNRFVATFADGSTQHFDVIINATGIKRNIDNYTSLLTRTLLLKRLCQENPFGGVYVNPDNCSARVDSIDNERLKVLGQLTCGEFYIVNNVDIINWQVQLAVDDVCRKIVKNYGCPVLAEAV